MSYSRALAFLALAAAYLAADTLLNKFALGDGWQIFWPLNGITVAILITRPRSSWPFLLGAVALGTGAGEYLDDNPLASMLLQRALSLLEVTLSAALLPRFTHLDSWLRHPGLYSRFTAAVITGPLVSGLLAAAWFQHSAGQPYWEAFHAWALADALGLAAAFPVTIAAHSPQGRALFSGPKLPLTLATLTAAAAVMAVIFLISQYPLIFMLYPLLMLVDWVLGFSGSSLALCLACVIAVFLTEHGYGPFASTAGLGMSRNLAVQLYLGFHLLGFLPISILFLERRWMERKLRESLARAALLASVDGLTGIANRRTLDKHLEDQWRLALRRGTPLTLIMIDADHFKQYNDVFGHQAGDDCLRAIAEVLTAQVSRPGDLVARFGGEEFVVVAPDTPLEGAKHLATKIQVAVRELGLSHPLTQAQQVTVSIGCAALVPDTSNSAEMLVRLADQMLYRAKGSGRNCIQAAEDESAASLLSASAIRKRAIFRRDGSGAADQPNISGL
jgi:diguanylate cyclase (GGDEF)-like protein